MARKGRTPGTDTPQKRKELSFACFVIFPDGRTVPVEELTPEEHAQWQQNMLRRLSENMSDYYTQHPEQYARLPEVREGQ